MLARIVGIKTSHLLVIHSSHREDHHDILLQDHELLLVLVEARLVNWPSCTAEYGNFNVLWSNESALWNIGVGLSELLPEPGS